MRQRQPSVAKITHPQLSEILPRERVFHLLDQRLEAPVVWVSAPAGAGKTTVVSDYLAARRVPCAWYRCDAGDADLATFFYYLGLAAHKAAPRCKTPLPLLTSEYLAGIQTFARRFFEAFFSRVTKQDRFVLVLDDYHAIPPASSFHGMMAGAFDHIPDPARVIVLSRSPFPAEITRLQVGGKLETITYRDLRFTLDESKELVRRRLPGLPPSCLDRLCEKAQGWAVGLALMMDRARHAPPGSLTHGWADVEDVFAYVSSEIFDRTPPPLQDFLLKTSILPTVTVPLAVRLTGDTRAGRHLSDLSRHYSLVDRISGPGQGYQYHHLFQEFLKDRCQREFSPKAFLALQKKAAHLLEEAGQVEDSVRLSIAAGDHQALARQVIRHARTFVAQGRTQTVAEWISRLPPERVRQDPWLVYWSGLCRVPGDMSRARSDLLQAFAAFKSRRDPAGLYLSWAGIVDTFYFGVHEWRPLDHWIAAFESLRKSFPAFPSREIELIASSRFLMAIALRRMNRPALIRRWLDRVDALLRETFSPAIQMDVLFAMTVYCLWKGDYAKNSHLLEKAEAEIRRRLSSPFAGIRVKLMKGIHLWVTARYGEAAAALAEGLERSAQSGVHLFDSLLWSFQVAAQLAQGDLTLAADSLKKQRAAQLTPSTALDDFFLQVNSAWLALLSGNAALAVHHLEIVAAMVRKLGNPYYQALWNIGMAQAAYGQSDRDRAWTCLKAARRFALGIQSEVMDWYTSLISAYFLLQEGREKDGMACLRHGLALSAKQGFVHLEFYQPAVMRFLLGKALEEGLAKEHATGLIRTLRLAPPQLDGEEGGEPIGVEHWPYPVKVKTLGEFAVFREDQPLCFAGKPPKKPLDILKTLIALGGRNVPVARLTDTLWPDADGDAAGNSFKVNLHHLRQLLGDPEAIVGKGACLSVNPQRCLADALAFQHLADRALQQGQASGPAGQPESLALGERAIALYRGGFLQDEDGPLFVAARERLRHRFVRLVEMVMTGYEHRQEWSKAIGLGERSIEVDDLEERFYTRLMLCYRKMGRNDAAASTFDRFCRVLQAKKGGRPSPGMTALYRTLLPAIEAGSRS